jgi:ADP-ribose pyrophosphatase
VAGFVHLGDEERLRLHVASVVRATIVAPDGTTFDRDVWRGKAVVAMVPLLDDGRSALLIRQYRAPIDATLLEIPAGLCDVDGEDPAATAQRELAEEVGKRAGRLDVLAGIHPAAGFTDQHVTIYLATELVDVDRTPEGPEETHATLEVVALADVEAMVADRRLTDAKTIIGLLLARDRLASHERG